MILGRLAIGAALVLAWEVAAGAGWVDPFFLSRPSAIAAVLLEEIRSASLLVNIAYTLAEAFFGFAIGSAAGVVAGLVLARFTTAEALLDPYLTALNSLPRIALAPLFILWFGLGPESKVALGVSLVFFIVMINTRAGVKNASDDLLNMARLLGCTPRQRFLKVLIPIAVPSIFAGLKLGLVYALMSAVVGEMFGGQHGLGVAIAVYAGSFRVDGVFAILFVLAILSTALSAIVFFAERRLLRWQSPDL